MNYFHDIIQQFLGIFIYPRNLTAKSNILNFLWAVYICLIEDVTSMGGLCKCFWSLLGVLTWHLQIFRPVQLVVLVLEKVLVLACLCSHAAYLCSDTEWYTRRVLTYQKSVSKEGNMANMVSDIMLTPVIWCFSGNSGSLYANLQYVVLLLGMVNWKKSIGQLSRSLSGVWKNSWSQGYTDI